MSTFIAPIYGPAGCSSRNFLTVEGNLISYLEVTFQTTTSTVPKSVTGWTLNSVQCANILVHPDTITFTTNGDVNSFTIAAKGTGTQALVGSYSSNVFASTAVFLSYFRTLVLSIAPNITLLNTLSSLAPGQGQVAHLVGLPGCLLYLLHEGSGAEQTLAQSWALNAADIADVLGDLSTNLLLTSSTFTFKNQREHWRYDCALYTTPTHLQAAMLPLLFGALGTSIPLNTADEQQSWLAVANAAKADVSTGGAGPSLMYFALKRSGELFTTAATAALPPSTLSTAQITATDTIFSITSSTSTQALCGVPYDANIYGTPRNIEAVLTAMVGLVAPQTSAAAHKIMVFDNATSNELCAVRSGDLSTQFTIPANTKRISATFAPLEDVLVSRTSDGLYLKQAPVAPTTITVGTPGAANAPVQTVSITGADITAVTTATAFCAKSWPSLSADISNDDSDSVVFQTLCNTVRSFSNLSQTPKGQGPGPWPMAAELFNDNLLLNVADAGFDSTQLALAQYGYLLPRSLMGSYKLYAFPATFTIPGSENHVEAYTSIISSQHALADVIIGSTTSAGTALSDTTVSYGGKPLTLQNIGPYPTAIGANGASGTQLQIGAFFQAPLSASGDAVPTFLGTLSNSVNSSVQTVLGVDFGTGTSARASDDDETNLELMIGLLGATFVFWALERQMRSILAQADAIAPPSSGTAAQALEDQAAEQAAEAETQNDTDGDIREDLGAGEREDETDMLEDEDEEVEDTLNDIMTLENGGGNLPAGTVEAVEEVQDDLTALNETGDEMADAPAIAPFDADVSALQGELSQAQIAMKTLGDSALPTSDAQALCAEEGELQTDEGAILGSEPDVFPPDPDDDPVDDLPVTETL